MDLCSSVSDTCTNPMPAHGGDNCTGNTSRTISCNVEPCPGIQTKELVLRWFLKILHIAAKFVAFFFSLFQFSTPVENACVHFMTYLQFLSRKFCCIHREMLVYSKDTDVLLQP